MVEKALNEGKEKKRFKVPHTYVILFSIVIIMAILTYIIPASEYIRVEDANTGRTVIDPASFHYVEQNPTSFFDLWKAVPKGMKDASSIIFFIFIIAGAFNIITATGAIEAIISRIALRLKGRGKLMIPMTLFIFSIFGGTIGMAEESIIFVPLGIALSRALGYDAIVGTAIILVGAACGFTAGFMNSFTVGVAQGLAELPLFSGIELRLVIWVVLVAVTSLYVIRYATKVKESPEKSIVRELELEEKHKILDLTDLPEMKKEHYLVLATLAIGFCFIVYGVFNYGWYITEISAAFLCMGVIGGFLGKLGPSKVSSEFINGAKGIVFGALVVGVARSILIVMQDGLIMDTVIFSLSSLIQNLPGSITALGMYFVQVIINFFIPSGSGQAAVTMPIMVPLSDVLNINRQIVVLAYQFGDGITNSIIPTAASCMGALSVAKIPYEKWFRFLYPLCLIWIVIGGVTIIIASAMNYGPF